MGRSLRTQGWAARLSAGGAATIVAIGLVSAPPAGHDAPRPVYASVIQLRALAAEIPTPSHTAAATPQANATAPDLQSVVGSIAFTAAAVALTPVWYAAFPITLPASFVVAGFVLSALSLIGVPSTPTLILQFGLAGWAFGPLWIVREATSYVGSQLNPAAAVSNSRPAALSSSTSPTLRQDDRTKRGLAGSRRVVTPSVNADRKLTPHQTVKKTPTATTGKKRTGTAGSARTVSKKAQS